MNKIIALILAAGESKRMGSPKMLLPFMGKTIIECVVENVLESKVTGIIVVLGAEKDLICAKTGLYPVKTIYNENYERGMLSSVQCGMNELPDGYDAVIIFPGDMPTISPEVTNKIIGSYRKTRKRIIVPVYKTRRGHPVLIDSSLHSEIGMLDDDKGLRQLAQRFPDEVYEVAVENSSILTDIDTQEEYLKEINQIQ
jgi:molybdenum cofactor cytidylyltransferase